MVVPPACIETSKDLQNIRGLGHPHSSTLLPYTKERKSFLAKLETKIPEEKTNPLSTFNNWIDCHRTKVVHQISINPKEEKTPTLVVPLTTSSKSPFTNPENFTCIIKGGLRNQAFRYGRSHRFVVDQ